LAAVLLAAAAGAAKAEALTRVEARAFGCTPDGEAVQLFTLRNANGMRVTVMERGATITGVWAPDRDGKLAKVVLGGDTLEAYLGGYNAGAAVIGRYANRINRGRFTLDGTDYQVITNRGPHFLHGGKKAFALAVWRGEAQPVGASEASVRFRHRSPDGDDGFPGTVDVAVTYTLTDDNELRLDYAATADKPTPLNLTNHAYFNLAGEGDVTDTVVWIASDRTTAVDDLLIPTGALAEVKGTPLDFTAPTAIGSRLAQLAPPLTGYDHNYVLRGGGKPLALAAWAYGPASGRALHVYTDQPGMQFYTGKRYFRDGKPRTDVADLKHNAFCFETQHYPDSVNHPNFPSTILRPGQTFASTTVYRFSVQGAAGAVQRLSQGAELVRP
jgi:aldose 1-epimerase